MSAADVVEQKKDVDASKQETNESTNQEEAKIAPAVNFFDLTAHWTCSCGFKNTPSDWCCFACFAPLKLKKDDHIKLPSTMRALVKEEKSEPKLKLVTDYKVPEPEDGEILVKSYVAGFGELDTSLRTREQSFIPGQEAAGMVVKVGPLVKKQGIKIGSRVAIESNLFCNECLFCKQNQKHLCSNGSHFGEGIGTSQGALAEYFTIDANHCYKLTTENKMPWTSVVLLRPMALAANAVGQINSGANAPVKNSILVIGCDTVGCLVIAVLKSKGFKDIIACDENNERLETAVFFGASVTLDSNSATGDDLKKQVMSITTNKGVTRVIECTGNSTNINLGLKIVTKSGSLIMVGRPVEDLVLANPLENLVMKNVSIRTVCGRRLYRDWKDAEAMMKNLDVSKLVDKHRFELKEYQALLEPKTKQGKKLIFFT